MMASLRHPSIVAFMGVCPTPPCVLTEYCARGSLCDVIRAAKHSRAKAAQLDWPRRLNMVGGWAGAIAGAAGDGVWVVWPAVASR